MGRLAHVRGHRGVQLSNRKPHTPTTATQPMPEDLVSQLQGQLARLGELVYGTVGELQRDAPPLSVRGEALVEPPPEGHARYDARARAAGFAGELVAAAASLQALARRVPDPVPEADQLQRIRQLQQASSALREEVAAEVALAERKLQQAHEAYYALAEAQLRAGGPGSMREGG